MKFATAALHVLVATIMLSGASVFAAETIAPPSERQYTAPPPLQGAVPPATQQGSTQAIPPTSGAQATPNPAPSAPQTPNPAASAPVTLENPLKDIETLDQLLTTILGAVVYLGAIFVTIALIYIGFLFVAAQGNPEKLKKARQALMWTLIGGLILLGAQAISLAIQSTVTELSQ